MNGLLDDFLKPSINSRTLPRRSSNFFSNFSNSSASPPYHSGGISSASAHTELSGNASILLSHGSKLSQPVTSHTHRSAANTPRSGESGNDHSPALKQYPWSMKIP